ncbi:GNAT family N-acetyltransferase [Lysobacter claricitrinus]|uniref:GNAT family N-acetyltransferase n=1 Tax=Lysobacter claricitrinus TaxID=3367728 RepID=UPI0037DB80E3
MIIRAADASDAPAVAALSAQLGYPVTEGDIRMRLEMLTADAGSVVYVAVLDRDVIGWIAASRRITVEYGVAHEITGLVVDATRRRTGAGRALVDAAHRWAAERGADALVVRSNAARETSHAFYAGIGFARTKTQHVYRRAIDPASA